MHKARWRRDAYSRSRCPTQMHTRRNPWRLPACLVLIVGFFSATFVIGVPASSAGPTPGLDGCNIDTSRGSISATFAVQACTDGTNMYLHNNLTVALSVKVKGNSGPARRTETDFGLAADATRLNSSDPWILLPGDTLRIPLGLGPAKFLLQPSQSAGFYALALTVQTFVPGGGPAVIGAFTTLISELNADFGQYQTCRVGKNRIGKFACFASLDANVGFAVARAAVTGIASGALAAILAGATFSRWAQAQVPAVLAIRGSPVLYIASSSSPLQPNGLRASRDGNGNVTLAWRAPKDSGGLPVTGYSYQITTPSLPGVVVNQTTGNSALTFTDTICPANITCVYQVQAITSAGNGPFSNSATVGPMPLPHQPTNLSAARDGTGKSVLTWTAPADTAGLLITGYSYQVSTPTYPGLVLDESTGSTATTFTDPICPVTYTCSYQLQAITAAGDGPFSNVATVGPMPVAHQPTSLTAARDVVGAVVLTWTAPTNTGGLPIVGYSYRITSPSYPGGHADVLTNSIDTTATDSTVCLVTLTCSYQVQAITAAGSGAFSNSATVGPQ